VAQRIIFFDLENLGLIWFLNDYFLYPFPLYRTFKSVLNIEICIDFSFGISKEDYK
jgi:hypothetical protein